MVVEQFIVGQAAHTFADRSHGAHILRTVVKQLGEQRRVVRRDATLAHQMATSVVLAHRRAGEAASVFQTARRTVGAGLRGGAVELLQRVVLLQDVPKDEPLESGVVGAYLVACEVRQRATSPHLDLAVIVRIGHAQYFCGETLRIII